MAEKKAFNYIAQDDSGNLIEGTIKATDSEQVNNFFLSRGYIPLEINETSILNREIKFGKKRVKDKEIAVFARQFATMSNASVPIIKILEVIGSQTSNDTLKEIITLMTTDINDGISLSESMAKHPTIFSPIFINMVSAAEAGGFLTKALFSIADNMDAQVRLRAKIKSAMTYPVVIFILAIVLTIAMLIFIVPVFNELFQSLGGELPFITQILVFLSGIMQWLIIPIVGGIGFGLFWWKKNKNNYKVRKIIDPIKTKMPIFGEINQMIIMARFARNFASLHDAAVPISQIFDIVGATTGSVLLEESLVPVRDNVLRGGTIVEPMKKDPLFPKMLVEMTAIGEETGDIAIMLNKAAESYEYDIEAKTDQLSSLIEPLMLVFLGIVIGGMIIALYLPILSIGELLVS